MTGRKGKWRKKWREGRKEEGGRKEGNKAGRRQVLERITLCIISVTEIEHGRIRWIRLRTELSG